MTAEVATAHWSRREGLSRLTDAFDEAAARTGTVERWYEIGGLPVRLTFAGPALIPAMDPALSHLAIEPSSTLGFRPTLDVRLWDSASTGLPVPGEPEAGTATPSAAGDGDRSRDAVLSAYHMVPRILSLFDPSTEQAVLWVPDARQVPWNEVASPLRTILHWWARGRGLQFVHGGAVGLGGQAVLLAGPSGSGKSTSALACLLGGLDYLGDDYVLVSTVGGPQVHSLYSAAKLQPGHVDAFPALVPLMANPGFAADEKGLWFVQHHFPERTRRQAVARAVMVPHITGRQETTVTSLSAGAALVALAPSTIVQLSGADQGSLSAIAGFLAAVPAHRLNVGTDLAGIASAVRTFLLELDHVA